MFSEPDFHIFDARMSKFVPKSCFFRFSIKIFPKSQIFFTPESKFKKNCFRGLALQVNWVSASVSVAFWPSVKTTTTNTHAMLLTAWRITFQATRPLDLASTRCNILHHYVGLMYFVGWTLRHFAHKIHVRNQYGIRSKQQLLRITNACGVLILVCKK